MRRIGKFVALLLILTLFFGNIVSITVFAKTDSDFVTASTSDGETVIVSYSGNDKQITIPSGVTVLSQLDFYQSTDITIPSSVSHISENDCGSFCGCQKLENIYVDKDSPYFCSVDGVLYSKDMSELVAFPVQSKFTTFTIPEGVTKIANGAFYGAKNLKKVQLPESLILIGDYAFKDTIGLTSLLIPKKVTTFGGRCCFDGMNNLTDLTILSKCNLPENLFMSNYNLKSLKFGPEVIGIGDRTFYDCRGLTNVVLPDGLSSIGNNSFYSCRSLNSITIPNSVTHIGVAALKTYSKSTVIHGNVNSYAESYSKENGLTFQAFGSSKSTKYQSQNEDNQLKSAIEKALSCVNPSMSEVEKALRIHDYIAQNTFYDYAAENDIDENIYTDSKCADDACSPYGVLVQHEGVCEGYADTYELLMNRLGIETHVVTNFNYWAIPHAWNIIKIDGNYYTVDVTYDDAGDLLNAGKKTGAVYWCFLKSIYKLNEGGSQDQYCEFHCLYDQKDVPTPTGTKYDDKDNAFWENATSEELNEGKIPTTPTITLDTLTYSGEVGKSYTFIAKSNIGEYISAKSADNSIVKVEEPIQDERGWLIKITGLKAGTTTINVISACGVKTSLPITITESSGLVFNGITYKGSVMFDTQSYNMAPRNIYDVGVKLAGNGSTKTIKVISSQEGVATVKRLPNGNYRITGVSPGTTYITCSIYNGATELAHASIKVTVAKGVKQGGVATRNTSYFN